LVPSEPGYAAYQSMDGFAVQAPSPVARIMRFLGFLKKFWWIPLLTTILATGAAVCVVLWMPPSFTSRANLWETEKLNLPGGAAFSEDAAFRLGTQLELLRSQKMLYQTLTRLRAMGTNTIPLDGKGQPIEVKLNVSQAPRSTVVVVTATCANTNYAQVYLNELINAYLDYRKIVRKQVSGETLNSISDQVLRLERELKTYQEALSLFQTTNNIVALQERGTITGGYLARLETQLSDLKLEERLLEATARELEVAGTNSSALLSDPLRRPGNANPSFTAGERQSAFKELELLKTQYEKLARFLRPKHPKLAKLAADIERGQKLMSVFQAQSREQIANSLQAVKMNIESVEASIKEWEGKAAVANRLIAEASRLQESVSRSKALYDRLQGLLQNVDITRNIEQETLAILDPAMPSIRSYRHEILVLVLGIFSGVGLGLGLVFLVEFRDDRFNSLTEVTEKITDSIVGQVPEIQLPKRNPKLDAATDPALLSVGHSPLVLAPDDQRHMYAEAYRSLRSALLFLPLENGNRPKVVLITSAVPNEGKSTIATNLAKTLALGGGRVLLIDADLRKGLLHELLGLKRAPGLTEFLGKSVPLTELIQKNGVTNLDFISRGDPTSDNPGDLLLSRILDEAIALWRVEYDFVIIDACPVFAADDATALAPKVDGTLLVVRNRFSRARDVREALEHLLQRQARVIGVVFNRAKVSANSYYYYKYGDYSGHGAKDKKT
jgi:capsular exopolysaccharide synthesis family protein